MQQAFWAGCNPSIRFKATLDRRTPANESGGAQRATE
jgi:hypothetical protein